jgi:hypothetical protein
LSEKQKHPVRRFLIFTLLAGVVVYFSVKIVCIWISSNELRNQKESFSGNSSDLKNTVIVPTLDSPIQSGKNNIWCSSFQLAWNEMKDNVIKEPILITDAQDICSRLNSAKQSKTDLLPESYYAAAGKVSDGIIQKIRADMSSRFPSVPIPQFASDDALIAYAYLEAYIKFATPFLQNDDPLTFTSSSGGKIPVKSFGIWGDSSSKKESLCKQVEVLYCKIEDHVATEYALDLCKQTQPYQVVLAVVTPGETLESTYNHLQSEIKSFRDQPSIKNPAQFKEYDSLYVPDIFWTIIHHFNELEGNLVTNASANGAPISTAAQMIHFRLDRTGVTLKSETFFHFLGGSTLSRKFIFNKPFLLYLKKRDAGQPFFVMWVDNAELLTPFHN